MPTAKVSTRSPQTGDKWQREVDRCRLEIASIEALLRAGHPDVAGLVLALADWSEELRMIAREKKKAAGY